MAKQPLSPTGEEDIDRDVVLAELENEDPSFSYHTQRIEQFQAELTDRKHEFKPSATTILENFNSRDSLVTLATDQELLDYTTKYHRCIVHFFHPDFVKCVIMGKHLYHLAQSHHEVHFAQVDVRNIPFVVEKLKIRVLPCVVCFSDGIGIDRFVGFEGLGLAGMDAVDEFRTRELERRFVKKGILEKSKLGDDFGDNDSCSIQSDEEKNLGHKTTGIRVGMRTQKVDESHEDDGDDWD